MLLGLEKPLLVDALASNVEKNIQRRPFGEFRDYYFNAATTKKSLKAKHICRS